jgi:hypothetical protein
MRRLFLMSVAVIVALGTQSTTAAGQDATAAAVRAVDSPCPGGDANGLGKARPSNPLTECGIALTRNIPLRKCAT